MTAKRHQACLLLGSNIRPGENLALALELLGQNVTVIRRSSVWETLAVGSAGPDFLNLALLVETPLDAPDLKEKVLRPLETQLGRVRTADKNAPRPIALDIIIFDDRLLDPGLWRYAYRAVPVAELLPAYRSTRGDTLGEVASELAKTTPVRLKPDVLVDRK